MPFKENTTKTLKIGTNVEWANAMDKLSNTKNSRNTKDETLVFWFEEGSNCFKIKETIQEIKKISKEKNKSIEEIITNFGLTEAQYKQLKKVITINNTKTKKDIKCQ